MTKLEMIALEDRCTPATITVTNLLDGTATGDGVSLWEAVLSIMKGSKQNDDVVVSTAYGSNDTIVFDAKLAGKTIPVDVADPASDFGPSAFAILKTVTIRGDATQGMTIQRNAQVTSTSNLRLFNVLPTGTLTLQNLTLQDGRARGGDGASGASGSGGAAGMGGAIFNRGTVSMSAVTLSGNQAIGGNGTVTVARADNGLGGGGGVGEDGTILNGGDGGAPNGGTRNKAAGFGGGGASGGGNGGFGGGGGAGAGAASGTGGYGGGGGATYSYSGPISPSVFAGGNGVPFGGGGGAAMGGAVFNAGGTTNLTNVTFSGNSTQSGNGGVGAVTAKSGTALGAALYNLNGSVTSINSTFY